MIDWGDYGYGFLDSDPLNSEELAQFKLLTLLLLLGVRSAQQEVENRGW